MSRCFHSCNAGASRSTQLSRDDRASQIVEFAVSLPLLVLFVVGIFDFSGAISLKQKLANAAREAARVAAADPANDLSGTSAPMPVSVNDAVQVVDNYLVSEKINDCQLTGAAPTPGAGLTWSFNAQNNGCPAPGITLTINRGFYFPQTATDQVSTGCASVQPVAGQTAAVGTCVIIQYPYKWQFTGVSGLFGGHFLGPTVITTTAVAFNEN
jgi:Flp pilus assembly protein TadG